MKSNVKQEIIKKLEEIGRKKKIKLWKDIAKRLQKPTRQKPRVNLDKIDKLAKKNKDKYLLIYGKILGRGDLEESPKVIYIEISEKAKEKIKEKKGELIFITEALNIKPEKTVIVK